MPLAATTLLSISMSLMTLSTSFKSNYRIFGVFLWLAFSLGIMSSSFIHLVSVKISSFFKTNILLCVDTTFCLSTHPSVDTWVAATFWLSWKVPLWTWAHNAGSNPSVLSDIHPEVGLLSHVLIACLILRGNAILFSTAATQILRFHHSWLVFHYCFHDILCAVLFPRPDNQHFHWWAGPQPSLAYGFDSDD